jgi:hypothetical protein
MVSEPGVPGQSQQHASLTNNKELFAMVMQLQSPNPDVVSIFISLITSFASKHSFLSLSHTYTLSFALSSTLNLFDLRTSFGA